MAAGKELVLCLRVRLLEGHKLARKDLTSADPYCKVWVGPKGMMEAPDRGYYMSTVCSSKLNPSWKSATKINQKTKERQKKFKEFMLPLSEPQQDNWTFFWKEGTLRSCPNLGLRQSVCAQLHGKCDYPS